MTWNNFYGLKQTIVACWDRPLLDLGKHEIYDPIHATDYTGTRWIARRIEKFEKDKTAYALTLDKDDNFHLWVEGFEAPMPDDGGDDD